MSWQRFLERHASQGRDRADGYDAGDFAGMSDGERAQARAMMLAGALSGDDIDLRGLRHVGDAQTVDALVAHADAGARAGARHDIARLQVLFELTADVAHLSALAAYLDDRHGDARDAAAAALAWLAPPPAWQPVLVERIDGGRHEAVLPLLLQSWIGLKRGAPCDAACAQDHLAWMRQVIGARPGTRKALLDAWSAPPA